MIKIVYGPPPVDEERIDMYEMNEESNMREGEDASGELATMMPDANKHKGKRKRGRQ